jgi:glucokinase
VSDCAAEVGHMTINLNGRRCGCGNDGCLEAYASGPAIAARAIEQLRAGAASTLSTLVDGALDRVTAATVYAAAAAGDELANEVVRDTALYLGVGVANLVNIFNPDCVVIAGGVIAAGDHLLVPLRREVARRAFRPAVEACTIVPAALGNHAGVIGAARVFMLTNGIGAA